MAAAAAVVAGGGAKAMETLSFVITKTALFEQQRGARSARNKMTNANVTVGADSVAGSTSDPPPDMRI
jgi:hypothetical protein